jgi:Predicted membrane protein (DUF2231)
MSLNPFDIHYTLLAKHAQHVVLIHFPIALFAVGVLFDFLAQQTKRRGLAEAAYFNFLVAAISTVPVLATGILAWQFALEGQKLNLSPDGSDQKSEPGLVFSSNEDCFKLDKGIPTVVEFVARTAGTYSFHCCNRCGIGHSGMKGQLVVEP